MKKLKTGIVICALVGALFGLHTLNNLFTEKKEADNTKKIIKSITNGNDEENTKIWDSTTWNRFYKENEDFIGFLEFDDEFIEEPICQTDNNSYYLDHNFFKKYHTCGTVFESVFCNTTSQNITIYGHNTYDKKSMFSPINLLVNQEEYDKHNKFKVYLSDEVRSYQIAIVYYFPVDEYANHDYQQADFETYGAFAEWIDFAAKRNLIESDVTIHNDDNVISLFTCRANDKSRRIIAIAKEIQREKYIQ